MLKENKKFNMLTCYDFQTAQLLNETSLEMILVGDSLANVVLGYPTTISASLEEMIIFGQAVRRGAPDKFLVLDMPFGSYRTISQGLRNACLLFQKTSAEAIKIEGAYPYQLELIERLTQIGIPVMGHIGLKPQSVHQMGGYFTHGKNQEQKLILMKEAADLQAHGAFAVVLECIEKSLAKEISQKLIIPTIGIGSGQDCDGQVLVINDLLHYGAQSPPSFCKPEINLYEIRKKAIEQYLKRT